MVTPKQGSQRTPKELFPRETEPIPIKKDERDEDERKQFSKTPNAKSYTLNGPRTPTPFKNALNEIRKIHGQPYVPSSPNGLVEDITEIMNKEQLQDSAMDSVYETDSSAGIQTAEPENDTVHSSNPKRLTYEECDENHQKKVKKSMDNSWNTTDGSEDFPYLVETPVRNSKRDFKHLKLI